MLKFIAKYTIVFSILMSVFVVCASAVCARAEHSADASIAFGLFILVSTVCAHYMSKEIAAC